MKRLLLVLLFVPAVARGAATLQEVASGLSMPTAIANADDSRLFVVGQRGQIQIVDEEGVLDVPFLDIRDDVLCCHEQGMLSLAFHPRYAENGLFYVSYVNRDSDLVVARFAVSDDPDVADPASREILLTVDHRGVSIHYAGQLAFGPDHYLYISTGDATWVDDDTDTAQDLTLLLGKVLRVDVDAPDGNLIPPTNPFVGVAGARPEIWAYGFRNPWRFSFDRETGDLWISDVGESQMEEVNFQPASSRGGENYGWRQREGSSCHSTCLPVDSVRPLIEYAHSGGACAIAGGFRYRGSGSPERSGMYLYGDFCSGEIRGISEERSLPIFYAPFPISTFGEDAEGELYVADYSGRVFAIVDEGTQRTFLRRRRVNRARPF